MLKKINKNDSTAHKYLQLNTERCDQNSAEWKNLSKYHMKFDNVKYEEPCG